MHSILPTSTIWWLYIVPAALTWSLKKKVEGRGEVYIFTSSRLSQIRKFPSFLFNEYPHKSESRRSCEYTQSVWRWFMSTQIIQRANWSIVRIHSWPGQDGGHFRGVKCSSEWIRKERKRHRKRLWWSARLLHHHLKVLQIHPQHREIFWDRHRHYWG